MAALAPARGLLFASTAISRVLWQGQVAPFALSRQFSLPSLSITLPALTIGPRFTLLPSLSELWDSILRAVPKKKQSHSRKRMRQLAGKALRDVIALNDCPGCGSKKRAHHLCPTCVDEIREMWKAEAENEAKSPIVEGGNPGGAIEPPAEDTRGSGSQPTI
ncbi:hypothetical protein ABW19_dt0202654 [Dactylella cylindrospora]|nr:hypothetical protein ABW19_dt0202654 [Dactylella cylindrospora]